jgi:very-short-patch-repair endonuclease
MLACLDLQAVASHRTSAALNRSGPFDLSGRPDVMVRHARQSVRSPLARVWTTTNLGPDDIIRVDGIPCLNLARTLMVLAAQVPPLRLETLRDMVDVAVRDGLATDAWLWWRLERLRCRGRGGVTVFSDILTERAGGAATESWLEREFLRVIEVAGLPRPVTQAKVRRNGAFVARVDFLYPAAGLVIEVTGQRGHSTPAERTRDADRRNELQLQGFTVLEFTYSTVVQSPAIVVRRVREALAAHQAGS